MNGTCYCGNPIHHPRRVFCSDECKLWYKNHNLGTYGKHVFDDTVDRERDLQRQRDTFGFPLRELVADPTLPAPASRSKNEHRMRQLYYRLLGKESRDEAG